MLAALPVQYQIWVKREFSMLLVSLVIKVNKFNKLKHNLFIAAKVYFKQISHSAAVVEGEKLKLHCIAYGTDPEIKWVIGKWIDF